MKIKIFTKSLSFSFIILFLFSINIVQAAPVWGENFEDLPLDGWDFFNYEMVSGIHEPLYDPGFSVVDGVLRAPNHNVGSNKTSVKRNSTIAYGTWSFDWLASPIASPIAYDGLELILNEPEHNFNSTGEHISTSSFTGYAILIDNMARLIALIMLHEQNGVFSPTIMDQYSFETYLEGTHHIDATRDSEGQFYIYFDKILVLQATENSITTSQVFGMTSWRGDSGIDNIRISDTVDYPPPPGIPATTGGYIMWMVIPTIIILMFLRKKVKHRN
jgi:hypothetical protein